MALNITDIVEMFRSFIRDDIAKIADYDSLNDGFNERIEAVGNIIESELARHMPDEDTSTDDYDMVAARRAYVVEILKSLRNNKYNEGQLIGALILLVFKAELRARGIIKD